MDFYQIVQRSAKKGMIEIYPDWIAGRSSDMMVRGKNFYAIWDEKNNRWSTDEYDLIRLVDEDLLSYKEKLEKETDSLVTVRLMGKNSSKVYAEFKNHIARLPDNSTQLDNKIVFLNTQTKRKDYVSKHLPYSLEEGPIEAWDELIKTICDETERQKIEWAIGSVVAGDSKDIQKFIVLYGEGGAGKSTILNIIQKLFDGYYTMFDAKALTSSNSSFSTEPFRSNPLVGIQHEGDLSKVEENGKLNSIVAHEPMVFNEKFKPTYTGRANCFLFIATNNPVKITDAKSGLKRRLIDVRMSGRKLSSRKYDALMSRIDFELGAIAKHCLDVYLSMGKNAYSKYVPLDMIYQTNPFFNFMNDNSDIFKRQDGITLKQLYEMWKTWCEESGMEYKLTRYKVRDEAKSYFGKFDEVAYVDGKYIRSYFSEFLESKFVSIDITPQEQSAPSWIVLDNDKSIFDEIGKDYPAQYANQDGLPYKKWDNTSTTLKDLNTKDLHYVKIPNNHIIIDFDIKDDKGNKSFEKNLEAASKWPPTYCEFSKSKAGLHLHYIYEDDTNLLSSLYSEGVEIKVFNGDASLRRKLTKCNSININKIKNGLPLKEEKKVISFDVVKSEKSLRNLIIRNLNKEIHPSTAPSISFIEKILNDAYNSGLKYDVTDMRPRILAFANNSTHQAQTCIKIVSNMKFSSEEGRENHEKVNNSPLVFFDVEVFPNLTLVCWKYAGKDNKPVAMINPKPRDIEKLLDNKLVGFNCRRYDNHILYALLLGYDLEDIYNLSQKIISESKNSFFGEAYNISYTDVYDFASSGNKKSLKKFEIELGIHHQELGLPWDRNVSEELWPLVIDYCFNDVIATEETFYYLSADWTARQILAELSGLTVNDTTNQHSIKIIFGDNKKPQSEFNYTDLSETFHGYSYDGNSIYRGIETGEGGYVYAEPGYYENVALLDVASMHPTSIEVLNLFGDKYTDRFSQLKRARLAIKHNKLEELDDLLNGKLRSYVNKSKNGEFKLSDLSNALKTVINSIYGLTSATFPNPFKDPRNKDNIVAKRGALFMIDLQFAVQEKGYTVAHIKTDSIKIPNADKEIIEFIFDFGRKYGYTFEYEATYDKFFLANDAVYIARYGSGKDVGKWTATGTQFAQPYVFKTLFSKEEIVFSDLCETKSVNTAFYLDMNEGLSPEEHNYHFVGKTGLFCPIRSGCGGGILLREKDGKYYAATGTKGYRWLEAEVVKELDKIDCIDLSFYERLVETAKNDISKYVDFNMFVS